MPSRPMFPHSPHFLFLSSTRSHDGYFPEVDQLVRSISFCRVKQLYFPFSAHFTNSFPAISPDDCPPYIPSNIKDSSPVPQLSPEDANNSLPCYGYPDPYEHMRNPRFTSVKVRRTAVALMKLYCMYLPGPSSGETPHAVSLPTCASRWDCFW